MFMRHMIGIIKKQVIAHKSFLWYTGISVFVTGIDVMVSRLSELLLHHAVIANTIGVVTGFIIQYFLTSRKVYNSRNMRTFVIFLLTFLLGLVLANLIVFVSRGYLFHGSDGALAFLVSKGLSIVLPFFVMYFIRKKLLDNN